MTKRRIQKLFLAKGAELVIETPEGLIKITHEGGRHFRFDLPENMAAHRMLDVAMARARFLKRDGDGRIVPSFQALVPVVDDAGEIARVEPVKVLGA